MAATYPNGSTVGRYGNLTSDEAQRKAKAIPGSVAAGTDLAGDLAARRREMTIAALVEQNAFAQDASDAAKAKKTWS